MNQTNPNAQVGQPQQPFRFHIGQRNVKTAVAASLCALLYYLVNKNPTFACIGAIFGLGSDMDNSRLNGGNRFYGTVIGGLLGMLLFRIYIIFYPEAGHHPLILLLLFIGVVLLIIACQLFRWPGGVQPGGVVLCIILFNTPVDTYISYSINRMIDTGVGVAIALLINWIFSRDRVTKWLIAAHLKKNS
ncbi:MAG: FUSC family protein [Lachnospiraceae bacterium]|nr:FUSC family protein [Lachnospiraceae bacterium]